MPGWEYMARGGGGVALEHWSIGALSAQELDVGTAD